MKWWQSALVVAAVVVFGAAFIMIATVLGARP